MVVAGVEGDQALRGSCPGLRVGLLGSLGEVERFGGVSVRDTGSAEVEGECAEKPGQVSGDGVEPGALRWVLPARHELVDVDAQRSQTRYERSPG